jgi:hypothetical protein
MEPYAAKTFVRGVRPMTRDRSSSTGRTGFAYWRLGHRNDSKCVKRFSALLPASNAIAWFYQKVSLSANCICRGIDPERVEVIVPKPLAAVGLPFASTAEKTAIGLSKLGLLVRLYVSHRN